LSALGELARRAGAALVCHEPGGAPCAPDLRGALFEAAHGLLEAGWTPAALDAAARAAGLPAGPCAQEDAVGLGVGAALRAEAAGRRDPRLPYVAVADRLDRAGRSGRRSGAGFFRYADPFGAPRRDPRADALLADARRDAGRVTGPNLSAASAVLALHRAVQEAAAACTLRGVAGGLVDLVAVEAGVFPARRGGPVHATAPGGAGAVLSREGHPPTQGPVPAPR
jgi:3-hydroxyacyl-CoA dehydrogenase